MRRSPAQSLRQKTNAQDTDSARGRVSRRRLLTVGQVRPTGTLSTPTNTDAAPDGAYCSSWLDVWPIEAPPQSRLVFSRPTLMRRFYEALGGQLAGERLIEETALSCLRAVTSGPRSEACCPLELDRPPELDHVHLRANRERQTLWCRGAALSGYVPEYLRHRPRTGLGII
jgi:hypothetical protein